MSYNQVQTNVVDIYDNSTSAWSAGKLSQKRELMAVAVVGGKVLFAGGYNYLSGASRTVDIYDATTRFVVGHSNECRPLWYACSCSR